MNLVGEEKLKVNIPEALDELWSERIKQEGVKYTRKSDQPADEDKV